ncbi:uncharacterized protein LOC110856359 [Folsomia candida]|uniref:uncharacterized protein LOC110856359 n=1 Tax=Folsomia candida TaxID=158441 RepID=UPI001604B1A8|nr:uncharacterized protein LOC110856359 [Folsomia candida]
MMIMQCILLLVRKGYKYWTSIRLGYQSIKFLTLDKFIFVMKLSSFLAIFAIFLALISVIVAHPQFGDDESSQNTGFSFGKKGSRSKDKFRLRGGAGNQRGRQQGGGDFDESNTVDQFNFKGHNSGRQQQSGGDQDEYAPPQDQFRSRQGGQNLRRQQGGGQDDFDNNQDMFRSNKPGQKKMRHQGNSRYGGNGNRRQPKNGKRFGAKHQGYGFADKKSNKKTKTQF